MLFMMLEEVGHNHLTATINLTLQGQRVWNNSMDEAAWAQWAFMVFDKAEQVKWLHVRVSPCIELANYKLSM